MVCYFCCWYGQCGDGYVVPDGGDLRDDARNRSYDGARNGRVTAFDIRAPNSGTVYLDHGPMPQGASYHYEVGDGLLVSVADPNFGWRWEIKN